MPFGPIEENLAQLFSDFKRCGKVKNKAKFGKCNLQSYKFKIYLCRTDTSVIDNRKLWHIYAVKIVLKDVERFTLIS